MAGRNKNEPLEKETQRTICDWLAYHKYFFWRNNSKPIYDPIGKKFRAMPKYTPKGLPDIIVLHNGLFIGLEVKRSYAQLRPEQADFGLHCKQSGGLYYTVHNLKEVIEIKEFDK